MENKICIYTISDPITLLVRYVGKTKCIKERFRRHLTENNKTYKSKWIKGLRFKGLKPVFEIIDECEEGYWEQMERFYIRLFKSLGAILLNQLPGGEGGQTMLGRKLTPEQSKKISLSKIGKKNPATAKYNVITKGIKIGRYDLLGNLLEVHPSIRHAAGIIGRDSRRIQLMIKNTSGINHVGGYKFIKLHGANY